MASTYSVPEVSSVKNSAKVAFEEEHGRPRAMVSINGRHGDGNPTVDVWKIHVNEGSSVQLQFHLGGEGRGEKRDRKKREVRRKERGVWGGGTREEGGKAREGGRERRGKKRGILRRCTEVKAAYHQFRINVELSPQQFPSDWSAVDRV